MIAKIYVDFKSLQGDGAGVQIFLRRFVRDYTGDFKLGFGVAVVRYEGAAAIEDIFLFMQQLGCPLTLDKFIDDGFCFCPTVLGNAVFGVVVS